MQHSPSWGANWFWASQETPRILWNQPPHPTSWISTLILSFHSFTFYKAKILILKKKGEGKFTLEEGRKEQSGSRGTSTLSLTLELDLGGRVDCVWNVMTRAETRFQLSAKRTSPFKSAGGASVQSTIGSWGVRISNSNAGYTMFQGSVKSTSYPLHLPVSPSLPLLCITVCHHISTGLYTQLR